ncbi:hypothetical protein K432DRAFT_29120 [Lepidopterella palustris CBS 459.81]|uniref:Myb-like domain-containing protein n=1 Tax=Lepidopterella palustris CBS 459.81 TaxID=1314670 RepID=A0A8E2JGF5_9PEZI|nr:hypothetical protein K432DRAFT_29120 [Lepidopterella palustris CBS 459.81]
MGQWRQDNFVSDPLWAAPPLPVRTPDRRFTPQSRSVPTRRRPLSPPSGSLWAMQDTYATLRPLNTVARRILHAPTGSRTGERRGEDGGGHERCADSGSTHSDDFEDSSTYLEGYLPTYSANTSIKRRGQQGRQGRQPHHQFSQEDDDLIIQLKNERRPWAEICSHWQDRAPWTIQFRYRKHLKNRIPAAISLTRDDSGVESTDDKLQQSEYAPKERSKTHDLVSPRPSHQPRKISLGIKPSKTLSSPVPPHGATDSNPINGRNVEPRWNQITKYATPRLQARDPSVSSRTGEVAGSSPSPGVSELRESGLSPEIPESMEPGSVPDTLQTRPEIMDSIELSVSPIVADMREPETTNKMVISRRHRTPPKTLEPIQPSIRRRTQETQAKTLKSRKRKASPQVLIEAEEANETASSPQLGNSNQKKYTALNLVNISELIASPQVSKTRNRVRPRSSIKKPNRNSLIRPMTHTPSRNKRTHSEAPSLKHRLQLDEDDSGDELAL